MTVTDAERDRAHALIGRLLDDPTEETLAAALEADRGGPGAVLALVHEQLVDSGEGFDVLIDDELFQRLLVIVATQWTPLERQRFADETLFAASSPDGCKLLARISRALFTVGDAERMTLAAIERGDDARKRNASHLAYFLFDHDEDYQLSDIGRRRLQQADPLRDA